MPERRTSTGSIELAYETFGDPGDPPLLLIMGLGTQMIHWDEELCGLLARKGLWVIRFDNRDAGHSSWLDDLGTPDLQAIAAGDRATLAYTLEDMAQDASGLLDGLGIGAAHVFGASLGGMIAQLLAIRQPERVRSLASMMSTTGAPGVGMPSPAALELLVRPAPADRESALARALESSRVLGSPEADPERVVSLAARAYDRAFHPAGSARQLAAAIAATDRTVALGELDLPAVVIHGELDQLVGFSGGEATARAIGGARLVAVPWLGHDLPRRVFALVAEEVGANARRA